MCTGRKHIVWGFRSVARQILIAVVLLAALPTSHSTSKPSTTNNTLLAQDYFPEVRLRKLHLVRPDLIPYPISYEVYC
jgi:hypothetical protein